MTNETLQTRAARLVQNEVHLCVSSIVHTLAQGGAEMAYGNSLDCTDAGNLMAQAVELAAPVLDFEEAAREAGWTQEAPDALWTIADGRDEDFTAATAVEACDIDGLEPHERVDTDFAGLNVWARTTTGQAISIDHVIEQITAELHAPTDDREYDWRNG